MGNQYQTTIHLMVSQYLTNIQISWANTGLPLSNQLMYSGFILFIFWPYTVLPILAQYRSHVQTIIKLYWTNIGPIWDTGMTVLDQTWQTILPIQDQYNHVYSAGVCFFLRLLRFSFVGVNITHNKCVYFFVKC